MDIRYQGAGSVIRDDVFERGPGGAVEDLTKASQNAAVGGRSASYQRTRAPVVVQAAHSSTRACKDAAFWCGRWFGRWEPS